MKFDKIVEDIGNAWQDAIPTGIINKDNPYHVVILEGILDKFNLTREQKLRMLNSVRGIKEDDIVKNKKTGNTYVVKTHNKKTQDLVKKNASPEDVKNVKKGDEKDKKEVPVKSDADTSNAINKVNDERHGVLKKAEVALAKGYIGKADAEKVQEFHQDINEFLKNPTQAAAEALTKEYKLSQNSNGKKLYLGFIAGNSRKLLGEDNLLVKEVSDVINKFIDLKAKGDVQKLAMNRLQGSSKPELATVVKSDDPGVQKIFSTPPYDRLDEKFHQVFGPTKDGKLLRPSNEHSKEYFQQSVAENTSLDKTIEVLIDLEKQGTASPGVRKALETHKVRMNEITQNFDKTTPEQRRALVEETYSQMAREMHEADPDIARGLMKNMAEMALYDSEIAGGDECYLPSNGTFPSGDKLRVDRDGTGAVEKIAAVSVKFGENNGFYGFPGESAQYQKFHPDKDKRTYMRNRVGHSGHSLGVRDDLIQDPTKFDKMLKESGLDGAIKNPEALREKLSTMQKKMDSIRKSITNDKGKYKNKDLVARRKGLEAINTEAQALLKEVVDEDKLTEIMGPKNAKVFMSGGCEAINIISMASVLNTSDGLSVIEHNHQIIDKEGLHSETDTGTKNLKEWKFQFRAFDSRGGGLLSGFVGPQK